MSLDKKQFTMQIKCMHIRTYKKNPNKKGNNWEKVSINSLFKQQDRKYQDYKFYIKLKRHEFKKFQERKK